MMAEKDAHKASDPDGRYGGDPCGALRDAPETGAGGADARPWSGGADADGGANASADADGGADANADASRTHDEWIDILNLNLESDQQRSRSRSPDWVPRSRSPIWVWDSPDPREPHRSRSRSRSLSPRLSCFVVTPGLRRILLEEPQSVPDISADASADASADIVYEPEESGHSVRFYFQQTTGPCGEELPIVFDDHVGGCLKRKLDVLVDRHSLESFYIGACVDPRSRWLGRQATQDRKAYKGHCEKWDVQVMLALTSRHGPHFETKLIEYAQFAYADACTNIAADSRGQVRGVSNWIYVCHNVW